METRLNKLCAGVDRTADMGAFPHDFVPESIVKLSAESLMSIIDSSQSPTDRDQAIWELVYNNTPENRTRNLPDLLLSVARSAKESILRRSASWALLKLGEIGMLKECLSNDDDGNTHSWKQTLIYESMGRTDWVDPRPVRAVESELGYAVTLPLTIHGVVQFREFKYGEEPIGASYSLAEANKVIRPNALASTGHRNLNAASSGKVGPRAFGWHSFAAGPIAQIKLVGALTAATGLGSLYEELTIQKVCTDPLNDGLDHVQGYLFEGMSRNLGGNVMAHYYTSRGPQPYYLSGRIGDASEGVIFVDTQLSRHAETHIVTNKNIPYPYVQSVRGLFFGPARMNTAILHNEKTPLDNLLQIVKDPYANGWFFGEFRSSLVDVDGDGTVELNGIEMYTDLNGNVVNRTPPGPQKSFERARW
jgi:hypothetical protein